MNGDDRELYDRELYDELFGQTDDEPDFTYPGTDRSMTEPSLEAEEPDPDAWDAKPLRFVVDGKEEEFFTIGQLAQALGRSAVTVRRWERLGFIPVANFRSPTRLVRQKAKRLYLRAQVEWMVYFAKQEGLMEEQVSRKGNPVPPANIAQTNFTARLAAKWREMGWG